MEIKASPKMVMVGAFFVCALCALGLWLLFTYTVAYITTMATFTAVLFVCEVEEMIAAKAKAFEVWAKKVLCDKMTYLRASSVFIFLSVIFTYKRANSALEITQTVTAVLLLIYVLMLLKDQAPKDEDWECPPYDLLGAILANIVAVVGFAVMLLLIQFAPQAAFIMLPIITFLFWSRKR